MHCETILKTIAVVQDNTISPINDEFFVVQSRQFWLESFQSQMGVIGKQSYSELYQESDDIGDMIEDNDNYIVNEDSDYSGEKLMDEHMLEDKEDTTTGEKE